MDALGIPDEAVDEFLRVLERRGRGSYTARSYRLGLAHFSGWLVSRGHGVDDVARVVIADYIADFGADRGLHRRSGSITDLATGEVVAPRRAARTVNHRLSVLSSFFGYLIERDAEGDGPWAGRANPVPARDVEATHGRPGGGDAPPRRARAELRRREARELPKVLEPDQVGRLLAAARSRRDKALLLILSRTGQRIGDWSSEHGRHGVLGMGLNDGSTLVDRDRSPQGSPRRAPGPGPGPVLATARRVPRR
ncbi:site-specific integrase [Xylanimonas cellulosilytica]|uniref:site-specific integrase n=1 Tax=Xylanimonas cellulosilytica TaxID=186189 RepID=UPI001650D8F4|nr:site-specific integrase [Xylanimonas cellulosilytica]